MAKHLALWAPVPVVCFACLLPPPLIGGAAAAWAMAGHQDPQGAVFKVAVQTVAVYATVRDATGRLSPHLTKADFRVLDNGKAVDITTFSNDVLPLTGVLLLDMSDSMVREYARVRTSALHLIKVLLPEDRLRIGSFGREVALSPLLTGDKSVLTRVINEELWPGGYTPLWRAAKAGMDSLLDVHGRRVLVIVTDGEDSGGDFDCAPIQFDTRRPIGACPGRGDVRRQADDEGFMWYGIGLEGPGLDQGLEDLADDSGGGHMQLRRDADLDAAFEEIADELHHQYTLGFTPAVLDGKMHKIEVRIIRPGFMARATKGYRAGSSQ